MPGRKRKKYEEPITPGLEPTGWLAAPFIMAAYEYILGLGATSMSAGAAMPAWMAAANSGAYGFTAWTAFAVLDFAIMALPLTAVAAYGVNEAVYQMRVEEYWRLSWNQGTRLPIDPMFDAKWDWAKRTHITRQSRIDKFLATPPVVKEYFKPGKAAGYLPGELPGMPHTHVATIRQPRQFVPFTNRTNDSSAFKTIYIERNAPGDRFRRIPR